MPSNKIIIGSDDWMLWLTHPLTEALMKALSDKRNRDNTDFIKSCRLDTTPHSIERMLYKEVGKTELLNQLVDSAGLKRLLRDLVYIEEPKPED